jgi:hypothetical protein
MMRIDSLKARSCAGSNRKGQAALLTSPYRKYVAPKIAKGGGTLRFPLVIVNRYGSVFKPERQLTTNKLDLEFT